jgi:DNA-directed RNA polymerase subunit alpha
MSLPGYAVTAVRIKGMPHEFATLAGVKESAMDIILNLKMLRVEKFTKEPVTLTLSSKGGGVVTAADIKASSDVRIVNPDLYLFTLEDKTEFEMDIVVKNGTGYVPAVSCDKSEYDPGFILVDALYSPIKKVRYEVSATRVGESTDLDKLAVEIETDGTIPPYDALGYGSKILKNYFTLFDFLPEEEIDEDEIDSLEEEVNEYTPVEALRLSPRTLNALINNNIGSVEELLNYSERRLLGLKGFGRKALDEINDKLSERGEKILED